MDIIAILSAAAAVAAASYAHYALTISKAAILSDLLSQFSDDQLGRDMGLLRGWERRHGPGFAAKYREAMRDKADAEETKELIAVRRRASQFFKKLARLNRTGLVDDKLIAMAFGKRPFEFCVEVLEPLDQAHSQQAVGESDDPYWKAFYERIREKAASLGVT